MPRGRFDVLVDEQLKPWLIEVNASPSLARDHPLDRTVKDALVADTLALVSPPYFDRSVYREMLRWRAAEKGGGRGGAASPFTAEMCALLHANHPRAHGQPPAHPGLYERIAPSPAWDRIHGRGGGGGGGGEAKPRTGGAPSGMPESLRAGSLRASLASKYL